MFSKLNRFPLHDRATHARRRCVTHAREAYRRVFCIRIARVETVNILEEPASSAEPLREEECRQIRTAAAEQRGVARLSFTDEPGQDDYPAPQGLQQGSSVN